jgi:hypothetical protein
MAVSAWIADDYLTLVSDHRPNVSLEGELHLFTAFERHDLAL